MTRKGKNKKAESTEEGSKENLDDLQDSQKRKHSEENAGSQKPDGVVAAKTILRLSEEGDKLGMLQLAAPDLTNSSATAQFRKAYLKLSVLVHPDILSRSFAGATKAFQALVDAFECLTRPEQAAETTKKAQKSQKISRSNDGCYVTKVLCPRCKQPWNKNIDGNPKYYYNFMMEGLKCFVCSTCLLEFGCMSAIHLCPFCNKSFEFHPDDYHRQITCGRSGKCEKKSFGFWNYTYSEKLFKEFAAELKVERQQRMKEQAAKVRRAAAARRRGGYDSINKEKLFALGLQHCCPRCGEDFTETELNEAEQRRHLQDCTDTWKHQQYTKKKQKQQAVQDEKDRKAAAQISVQSKAIWMLAGGKAGQLWLLDTSQLQKQCKLMDLDSEGDRLELIKRLVAARKGNMLEDKAEEVTLDTLPTNLHGMPEEDVKAVCLSHNLDVDELKDKSNMIELLEERRDLAGRITSGPSKKKQKPKKEALQICN